MVGIGLVYRSPRQRCDRKFPVRRALKILPLAFLLAILPLAAQTPVPKGTGVLTFRAQPVAEPKPGAWRIVKISGRGEALLERMGDGRGARRRLRRSHPPGGRLVRGSPPGEARRPPRGEAPRGGRRQRPGGPRRLPRHPGPAHGPLGGPRHFHRHCRRHRDRRPRSASPAAIRRRGTSPPISLPCGRRRRSRGRGQPSVPVRQRRRSSSSSPTAPPPSPAAPAPRSLSRWIWRSRKPEQGRTGIERTSGTGRAAPRIVLCCPCLSLTSLVSLPVFLPCLRV